MYSKLGIHHENQIPTEKQANGNDLNVSFICDEQLAESASNVDWNMGCGHDCCACNAECK